MSLAYVQQTKAPPPPQTFHFCPGLVSCAPWLLTHGDLVQPQDAIDFTDNDIQILGNFPLSPRIQTLLLARNRIATIQPNLPNAIPNLRNLVLASNQVIELSDLDVLGKFARLTQLVLADNPVTKKEVGFPPCRPLTKRRL